MRARTLIECIATKAALEGYRSVIPPRGRLTQAGGMVGGLRSGIREEGSLPLLRVVGQWGSSFAPSAA